MIDLYHKNNSTNTPFSFFFLKNRIKNKKNTDNNSCLSTENEAKHCKIRKIKENSRKSQSIYTNNMDRIPQNRVQCRKKKRFIHHNTDG